LEYNALTDSTRPNFLINFNQLKSITETQIFFKKNVEKQLSSTEYFSFTIANWWGGGGRDYDTVDTHRQSQPQHTSHQVYGTSGSFPQKYKTWLYGIYIY
jgi:hypothetical protein